MRERGLGNSRLSSSSSASSDSAVKKKRKRRKRTARLSEEDSDAQTLSSNYFNLPSDKSDVSDEYSPSASENISFSVDPSTGYVLDCSSDVIQCHTFSCRLSNLRANESAVIRIRSRVWNSTLVEEFPGAQLVVIQSRAKVVLPKLLDMHQVIFMCYRVYPYFASAPAGSKNNTCLKTECFRDLDFLNLARA